jgi:hypothetical protein
MSEVRKELMEATGLTQSRKQSDGDFREKLITAASDLPDKKWKALSKPTQKWATKAIDAFNDDGEIIEFDDADDAADEADDADAEEEAPPKKKAPAGKTSKKAAKEAEPDEEEEEKPKRTRTRAKSKDEDAEADQEGDDGDAGDGETDGDEPEGEEAEGDDDNDAGEEAGEEEDEDMASKPRRTTDKAGALAYAKKAMIKDPSITAKDLATRMEKAGYSMSSHTLSTTRSQFRHSVKVMQEAGLLKKALIT